MWTTSDFHLFGTKYCFLFANILRLHFLIFFLTVSWRDSNVSILLLNPLVTWPTMISKTAGKLLRIYNIILVSLIWDFPKIVFHIFSNLSIHFSGDSPFCNFFLLWIFVSIVSMLLLSEVQILLLNLSKQRIKYRRTRGYLLSMSTTIITSWYHHKLNNSNQIVFAWNYVRTDKGICKTSRSTPIINKLAYLRSEDIKISLFIITVSTIRARWDLKFPLLDIVITSRNKTHNFWICF